MTPVTRISHQLFSSRAGLGHSVVKALAEADAVTDQAATVMAIPLFGSQLKIIARDRDNQVVFYCECPASDAPEILGRLGVTGPECDITDMAQAFHEGGLDLVEAAQAAAIINAGSRDARRRQV